MEQSLLQNENQTKIITGSCGREMPFKFEHRILVGMGEGVLLVRFSFHELRNKVDCV